MLKITAKENPISTEVFSRVQDDLAVLAQQIVNSFAGRSSVDLILLTICIVVLCLCLLHYRNLVYEKSELARELKALNSSVKFSRNVTEAYEWKKICKSKREFESFDVDNYVLAVIESEYKNFQTNILNLEENKKQYLAYLSRHESLWSSGLRNIGGRTLIERSIFRLFGCLLKNRLRLRAPAIEASVRVIASYTSNKGKVRLKKKIRLEFSHLKIILQRTEKIIEKKKTREYQRAIMTDSLRYKILKRDKFRCKLCGASSQEDGVILHVDHIHPISKGGLTEESNLRALCDRCNLGKGVDS